MQPKENSLNFPVSTGSLLKYALPTILSNLFMNVYTIVDQLFVSNLLGTDALSAVSIAWPLLTIALAVGTMIGTGGCALVSNQMGAGDNEAARQNFSFFVVFCTVVSAVICVLGIGLRRPVLYAMGADDALYPLCQAYAVPVFLLIPFAMAGMFFQIFLVAAGKPGLGFGLSIAGGITNMVLDYVLIARIPLGITGAALATAAGYVLQSLIGGIFFLRNRQGTLYLVRPRFNGQALAQACFNGMSEMVTMLSITVVSIAMNVILMHLVGSEGVAASAVILSAQTILSAGYAGYVQGIGPVISFHYGAAHEDVLKTLYRTALKTIAFLSTITFLLAFPLARPIARLFAKNAAPVLEMAVRGTFIFAGAFLLMGFNQFASGFFTALNDGRTSAILSLFRTLIFLLLPLLTLPWLLGIDGVWMSMPVAEVLSIALSVFYFRRMKGKYHYA